MTQDNERKDVITKRRPAEAVNTGLPLLTTRQRTVLMGVLVDQRYLANLPVGADVWLSRDRLGRRRILVRDAQAGLVPMNLAGWIGRVPSNSDCVLYHREYLRLEDMGLLERHNLRGGRRTSHLSLTPAGKWVAERLLAEESHIEAGEPLDIADLDFSSIAIPPETHETENDIP